MSMLGSISWHYTGIGLDTSIRTEWLTSNGQVASNTKHKSTCKSGSEQFIARQFNYMPSEIFESFFKAFNTLLILGP